MNILLEAFGLVKDNQVVDQAIDRVGQTSLVTGAGIKAAEHAQVIETGWGIVEYAAMVSLIGGVVYIIKLCLEVAIKYREWRNSDG